MTTSLPSSDEIEKLERAPPGTCFASARLATHFLDRMQAAGFLDADCRRTDGLERLRLIYRDNGLALFLGAGVSRMSGIPTWRELLDSMLGDIQLPAPEDGKASLSRGLEESARLSMLAQFDLLAHGCTGAHREDEFVAKLRSHLYGKEDFQRLLRLLQDIPESSEEKRRHDWAPLLAELQENLTLAATGELLLKADGDHLVPNSGIHGVLTTNTDNLVQAYVMARAGGERLMNTVDRPSVGDRAGRISVYHLHGWLDLRDTRQRSLPAPELVFRESEYYDTIGDPNSFANYTAQSLFQRRSVLFIGTSLEDLNVRRWLYNTFRERRRHRERVLSGLSRDEHAARSEAYAGSIRHFWLKREKDLPEHPRMKKRLRDFLSDSMRGLGVEILWYQEHDEVSDMLKSLDAG